ncbi:MAG: acyltransferase family protein [Fidelibacterota bacterium]
MTQKIIKPKSDRLLSLDAFRGITIAGMILVNNPGSWRYVYSPLTHAEWHGWTPTDLIFPFFIFILGAAIPLSFGKRLQMGYTKNQLFLKVVRRTIILFALGLFLNAFPKFDFATLRIPGVLQRIALVYFFAAVITLKTGVKGQALTAALLLIIYWALMKLVPVPGYGTGVLGKEGNLAQYIDSIVLKGHMWKVNWDPEGILSTIPAVATALFGVLTGHWLKSAEKPMDKVALIFVMGNVGLVLGIIMNVWFPINKNLWTSSYVVFTAGMALQFLGICYWLIDIKGYKRWAVPFIIYGMNAILVYFLSGVVARILINLKVSQSEGAGITLKTYIYQHAYASWAGGINGSLFYALSYVLIWLGIMTIFYRKRIFIKI